MQIGGRHRAWDGADARRGASPRPERRAGSAGRGAAYGAALTSKYGAIRQRDEVTLGCALCALLPEPEDGQQCLVDSPLLFRAYTAHQLSKSAGVDGAYLLHEHAGFFAKQVNLGPERRRPRAMRRRRHQHYRAWQEFVGLDDYPIPAATLFVACPAWRTEFVDVTPEHACSP